MATFASSSDSPEAARPENETGRSVPRVFLAYRETPEGRRLAAELHQRLEDKYEVTFARETIPPGADWAAYLEKKLEEADFFVALMTQEACDASRSFYLPYEIETAGKFYLERARPVIIPVRVAHLEPYDYKIGAVLTRFQEVEVENLEDLGRLVAKALTGHPAPPRGTFDADLRDYTLSEDGRLRLEAAHVDLPALQRVSARLAAGDAVWLIGESGVTNYAARSLAAANTAGDGREVYVIPRGKTWKEVERTLVAKAIIVFPDALSSPFLSEDTAVAQFAALANLLSRGNRILLTAPEDIFEEARYLMRRFDFRCYQCERLHHASYSIESKRHILRTSLGILVRLGKIDPRRLRSVWNVLVSSGERQQTALTEEIRQRLKQALEKWTPSDIESFLLYHLPEVSRLADLEKALQRHATLESEIHAWFSDLTDSAKCFVLTVALVPGLAAPTTWERHTKVIDKLRRFDPGLKSWPIGQSRECVAPYVTQDGVLGFLDERIAEAVRREIARSYREYLIALELELRQWTLEGDAESLPKIRDSVATMIGDAARVLLDDLLRLIEFWSDHGTWAVREVAARALERVAADASSQDAAFELLASWYAGIQENEYRAWAAVATYGRIAARDPRAPDSRRALERLFGLASDTRNRVADQVVLAARKLVARYPIGELEELFHRLARYPKAFVRLHLAETVNAARLADEEAGKRLLQSWLGDADESLRGVAACCLILQVWDRRWRRRAVQALDILCHLLTSDAATLVEALVDAIESEKPERWRKSGFATLARLAKLAEERGSKRLAASLAAVLVERGDRDFLRLLREDGSRFDRLVIDVRAETWKLTTPDTLLDALEAEARQEPAPGEGHRIVAALVDPEETRGALTAALAGRFAERHETLEHVLFWLQSARQERVASLSEEIRGQALAALLASPQVFVDLAQRDLWHPERRAETWKILHDLARSGLRKALIQTLAAAHPTETEAVESLLAMFFTMGALPLAEVAREAMRQILEDLLASSADFVDQLQKTKKGSTKRVTKTSRRASPQVFGGLSENKLTWMSLGDLAGPRLRASLVNTLAEAHPTRREAVESLLAEFFARGIPPLTGVAERVMRKILEDLLDAPMNFIDQLGRSKTGPIWPEALDALEHLAGPGHKMSRLQVVRTFAMARREKPIETDDILLRDPSLRARKCLNYLWVRVRWEAFLQSFR